jgi:hypothetical protein
MTDKLEKEISVLLCKLEKYSHLDSSIRWSIYLLTFHTRQMLVDLYNIGGCMTLNVHSKTYEPEREMCPWAISKCFGDLVFNKSA